VCKSKKKYSLRQFIPPIVIKKKKDIRSANSVMLTEHDAMNIYEIKIACTKQTSNEDAAYRSLRGQSGPVSKLFGVSPRAIRDIWNRRTWAYVTKQLWSLESLQRDPDTLCGNAPSNPSMRV
jgi:hypothetical protein